MTIYRFRIAALSFLLMLIAFPGVTLAEQRQGQKPAPSPSSGDQQVEKTPAPDVERQREYDEAFYRPTMRLFQNYTLRQGDAVREVFAILADAQIDGTVRGDVGIVMGTATLGPTAVVEGSLHVIGGSAKIAPGAKVRRDLVVIGGTLDAPADFTTSGEHVIIGTPVIGDTLRAMTPWLTRGVLLGRLIVPDIGWVWLVVATFFLFGLFFNHVLARQVGACADTLARRPVGSFLVGLLFIVLAGPAIVIVSVTVIGLPFAIAAMIAANIIGKLAVTRAIGRSVIAEPELETRTRAHALRSYLIGAGILIVALMVPILGLMTWALIGVFGFGTACITFISSLRKERPAPAPGSPAAPPPPAPPLDSTGFGAPEPAPPAAPAGASFVEVEDVPQAYSSLSTPDEPRAAADVFRDEPPPIASVIPPLAPPAMAAAGVTPPVTGVDDLRKYPRASFLDRLVAFVLDAILVAIVNGWLITGYFGAFGRGPDNTYLAMLFAYHIGFWAWKGTTLGGIICNIRMVRTTGDAPRFADVLVRGLSAIFSVAALFIGCLWMLNDPERQMWHDKFAGTIVVKVPREVVLA